MNVADGYPEDRLTDHAKTFNRYGLGLIAGTLEALRSHADEGTKPIVMLSGRVPKEVRDQMIAETGWEIDEEYIADYPAKQDQDTDVTYVKAFDDGKRFYADRQRNQYISAEEAERSWRENVPIYHDIFVCVLKVKN